MRIHLIALLALGASFVGCGAEDVITTAPDCADVCNRYQECFEDDDYDVDDCIQNCTDAAIDDEEHQERVEACSDCLDRTCAEAAFACPLECAGIVP